MPPTGSCVMGCPMEKGQTLLRFPSNPRRRGECCRILGVFPTKSRINICSVHFGDCFIFGRRLLLYASPNTSVIKNSDPSCISINKNLAVTEQRLPLTIQKNYINKYDTNIVFANLRRFNAEQV